MLLLLWAIIFQLMQSQKSAFSLQCPPEKLVLDYYFSAKAARIQVKKTQT